MESRTRQAAGNVAALMRRELQRTWPSYLTSGLFNLFFGFIAVGFVWESATPGPVNSGGPFPAIAADLFFVLILANLSTNWTSTSYMQVRRDPFQEHLEFLRTLPVSAAEVVSGRAALMVLSTAVMACVFFAPLYALPRMIGAEAIRLGIFEYLGFAGVWAGYVLLSAGIFLYLEFGVRGGGRKFFSMMSWISLLLAAVLLCQLVLDVRLVSGSLGLATNYGPLAALAALGAGAAALCVSAVATVHRVREGGV